MRTTSSAISPLVSESSRVRSDIATSSTSGSAAPRYANATVYTVDAMWSRPIRIPPANSSRREATGESARSSQTAEAWVIVTSLSTPSPASTMPHSSTPRRVAPGARLSRSRACSPLRPVRRVAPVAQAASAPVASSPPRVPSSAVEVRTEMPCAR